MLTPYLLSLFHTTITHANTVNLVRYIYWALDCVRRLVQNIFDDYDRKKCKHMRNVFMKRSHTLTMKQTWYLHHYCDKSQLLI
ncbi:transposase [Alkalibacillus haloalkaliphilus]|uniref:transposase n=1 Tax=Alkalibacillus haloalkaliphilus TaxID=94136 RepID=UPI0011BD4EC2